MADQKDPDKSKDNKGTTPPVFLKETVQLSNDGAATTKLTQRGNSHGEDGSKK